jgi:acetyl-CoA carboxylase biotin carboxyl carrier protein
VFAAMGWQVRGGEADVGWERGNVADIEVTSEISGRVFTIEVGVGSAVSAGDTLMVLESMKMEIPVEAPRAGAVLRIAVAAEDEVVEGQVLAVLTT